MSDDKPDDGALPGEKPLAEGEGNAQPPGADEEHPSASRAAQDGPMTSRDTDTVQPTPGMASPPHSPSPDDAVDADLPGGSAANQQGNTPDS